MPSKLDLAGGLAYAQSHALRAWIVARGGETLAEFYDGGADATTALPLYSGTKSCWGTAALAALRDGLLGLDETVARTIPEWNDDPLKRRVTLRMLLDLTAGFGFGGLGSAVPSYERALATPLKNEPGSTFAYGGIALQVFGAVLARKLAPRAMTPDEYLRERVLEPANVCVAAWRRLKDGTHPLPTGASLTARDWLAYGRFVLGERAALEPCFTGSAANARYGLGWWLGAPHAPSDLVYASGSGGQALYIVPSLDLVVVHFGKSASYKHETLLRRLFPTASPSPRRRAV